ncbi:MAG: hypothetical protein LBV04_09820, partial [Deferribacteraceae bacterium]|nr:hypothetical protein [Deferribacteraceae bacterium]
MLSKIFSAVCIGCGGDCGYSQMLCDSCVSELAEPEHRCLGCGHPLAITAYYCKHCDDKAKGIDFYYSDYLYIGALRKVIYKIKYDWCFRGAEQLGSLCKIDGELLDGYDAIIPVPYHFRRRFVRFLQPVDVIAAALAARTTAPVIKLVERI